MRKNKFILFSPKFLSSNLDNLLKPKTFALFLFVLIFALGLKLTYQKTVSFGCFDDCANYSVGYFMTKGRAIYTEIPFNHQPLMLYLSYLIQTILKPVSLTQLLLFHRFSLFIFSLLMGLLILWRFRLSGFAFILFYELTKYYLFGERFLAESFIVYPLVYLFGLMWHRLGGKNIFPIDYFLAGIFTWFVIFSATPYIPLALILYILFLGWGLSRIKIVSLLLFSLLSLSILSTISLPDYFFNIFTINSQTVGKSEISNNLLQDLGIIKSFGYPFVLFFGGVWNEFRVFLVVLDFIFLILLGLVMGFVKKRLIIGGLFILGLANIRVVIPGTIFYEGFHMIQWYGIFLMMIFLMAETIRPQKYRRLVMISLVFTLALLMLPPGSYLRKGVDRHQEFMAGYGGYLATGEIIKILAESQDTLFLDNNRHDIVYWLTNLNSPYKYSWYTWMMPDFKLYSEARSEMFKTDPPDFYYGFCMPGQNPAKNLPVDYAELYFAGRPTCLYIRAEKIQKIAKEKWEKARGLQYSIDLPKP
ncbi:hypothetical protein HY439_00805 [Candidatus Microgenomates bacterium]|nr:hypothetical protein [Candidatus Microgenomates bacterium]